MRLLCPNCDAQYEVDDSVIPKDGRDVQCSSCGQTWFQQSAAQLANPDLSADDQSDVAENVADRPDPEPENTAEDQHQHDPEPEHEPEVTHERRQPDEAALNVLRQEAALETEARQEESQGDLETQPDLGLDQLDDNDAAINQRTARLRGIEPEPDPNASRGDMLPDIEEINSSLQNETAADTEAAITGAKRGRSGFRLGFGLIIIVATLLFLAYVYAPLIVEKIPTAEPYIASYVETVDGLRLWLDQLMQSATEKMSGGVA